MTQEKHTAGPWKINDSSCSLITILDGNGEEVADVYPVVPLNGNLVEADKNMKANAALIRTAPEMMKCLELIAETTAIPDVVYQQVLKIIKEARGEI